MGSFSFVHTLETEEKSKEVWERNGELNFWCVFGKKRENVGGSFGETGERTGSRCGFSPDIFLSL